MRLAKPSFNLLGLPREIRDFVYDIIYVYRGPFASIAPLISEQRASCLPAGMFLLHSNLLLTCRQIYEEATTVLYGQNTFRIWPITSEYNSIFLMSYFLEILRPQSRNKLQCIEIHMDLNRREMETKVYQGYLHNMLSSLVSCLQLKDLVVFFEITCGGCDECQGCDPMCGQEHRLRLDIAQLRDRAPNLPEKAIFGESRKWLVEQVKIEWATAFQVAERASRNALWKSIPQFIRVADPPFGLRIDQSWEGEVYEESSPSIGFNWRPGSQSYTF